ncbi:MAG: DNA repair protein RecN [Nitrospiria bacterium]
MLRDLRIQDFALIDHLHLTFGPRLNVLTGETGAGKSILIDAMTVLLGGRASPDCIRSGKDEAVIEAAFTLPEAGPVVSALQAMGYDAEDEVVIQRVVARSGKGRVYLNGRPVTVGMWMPIAAQLVDLHGQHDHQSLLRAETPLILLDAYAHSESLQADYTEAWSEWRSLGAQLEDSEARQHARGREMELLVDQIEELTRADVQPGEWDALERENAVLSQTGRLLEISSGVYERLHQNDGSVVEHLSGICADLDRTVAIDDRLRSAAELGRTTLVQLQELATELRDYLDRIQHNDRRLEAVQTRLDQLGGLRRKYSVSADEIGPLLLAKRSTYGALRAEADASQDLAERIHRVAQRVRSLAGQLRDRRLTAGVRLEGLVNDELERLKMRARFCVAIEGLDGEHDLGSKGADRVEFLISANPGEPTKPLRKVASGGELSRLMLALKTVLAQVDHVPTLIFDEVDAGIGGAVAEVVGRRLQAIAAHRQVLCVTHLPQVASGADVHMLVEKTVKKDRTLTRARPLTTPERTREIARMLAGEEITPTALRHAKEMIRLVGKPLPPGGPAGSPGLGDQAVPV